jgi:hypothetical protein
VIGFAVLAACGPSDAPSDGEPPSLDEPAEALAPKPPDPEPAPLIAKPAPKPKAPAAPPAAEPAPPPQSPPAESARPPADPAISLDELGDRIKKSDAIGVFTKLALKNDVDALVDDLSRFHESGNGQLAALRERYEALVLKLIALLEKKEPDLAVAISRSRDTLWRRLADPVRFAELTA